MRSIYAGLLLLLVSYLLIGCSSQKKWTTLFNGKDLNDWTVKIRGHKVNENFGNTFRVQDGVIRVNYDQYDAFDEQYGHMFYKKKYSSYLLRLEYRFIGEQVKGGPGWAFRNSGVMLHCQSPESMAIDQDFPISIETQYLGGNGKDERTTGNLCTPGTNVFLKNELFTPHCVSSNSKTYHGDQWVKAEVLVIRDSIIKHIIEGDTVLVYTKPQYDGKDKWVQQAGLKDGLTIKEGFIALQSESHPVEFRNIRLFDLENFATNPVRLQRKLNALRKSDQ